METFQIPLFRFGGCDVKVGPEKRSFVMGQ